MSTFYGFTYGFTFSENYMVTDTDILSLKNKILLGHKSAIYSFTRITQPPTALNKVAELHGVNLFLISFYLPRDAPFWFDALNGGIIYVLKGQALPHLSAIHAHADLNRPHPRQRGGGVTHNLGHSSPVDKTDKTNP